MPIKTPSTFNDYGGAKEDYSAPVSSTYDRSAAEVNKAFADLSELTRMTPKARVSFVVDGTPSVVKHQALWGKTQAPNVVSAGTGVYNVTLPAVVNDPRNVSTEVLIEDGDAQVSGTALYHARLTVTGANTFTVRVWNSSNVLADPPSTAVISARVW